MASQAKINVYMERHRIGPLFEDLMNRILRDMPEEPMIYLLRTVYKKAGMEIPQGIRYGGLRKSTVDLPRGSSPERPARSAQVSSSADVAGSRDYDKPWATSPTRRSKLKKTEEGRKSKPEWNSDNKTKHLSSFDEFWEGADAGAKKERPLGSTSSLRKTKQERSPAANAWASVGLEDYEEPYVSPPYRGPAGGSSRVRMTEEELLASEMLSSTRRSQGQQRGDGSDVANTASTLAHVRKGEVKKHRQQLGEILTQSKSSGANDSGFGSDQWGSQDSDDDAIELLENADDLRREGVVNIPKGGYKLSRNLRYRQNEPRVKLNINLNPDSFNLRSDTPRDIDLLETPRSSPEQRESESEEEEEEFESVSQVTGPRHPVWKLPGLTDSKSGTSMPLRPTTSSDTPSRHQQRSNKPLSATTPTSGLERAVRNADDLSASAKTWTDGNNRVAFDDGGEEAATSRSVQSETSTGGWHIPDDTDMASGYDWDQRVKGRPPRDPRAY